MYIPEFVCGIVVTIIAELLTLIIYAICGGGKRK